MGDQDGLVSRPTRFKARRVGAVHHRLEPRVTLRCAPASWSAVVLHRFSPGGFTPATVLPPPLAPTHSARGLAHSKTLPRSNDPLDRRDCVLQMGSCGAAAGSSPRRKPWDQAKQDKPRQKRQKPAWCVGLSLLSELELVQPPPTAQAGAPAHLRCCFRPEPNARRPPDCEKLS